MIEGCFAFNLNPEDYQVKAAPSKDASYSNALKEAVAMEEKILKFYGVAAEQSKHLMADVPRNFTLVAKKRNERIPKLKELLEKATQGKSESGERGQAIFNKFVYSSSLC